MKLIRDSLRGTPAELIAELDPAFPQSVRVRTLLASQLGIRQSGDPAFDKAFLISGNECEASAVLDAETRKLMLGLEDHLGAVAKLALSGRKFDEAARQRTGEHTYVRLGDRRLQLRSAMPLGERAGAVRAQVDALLTRLARPWTNIPELLLSHVLEDSLGSVRNRCLLLLLKHHGRTEAAKTAARKALNHSFPPQVQLLCAAALGKEAVPAWRAIAENELVRDELRAEALESFAQHWHQDSVEARADLFELCLRLIVCGSGALRACAAAWAGRTADEKTWSRATQLALSTGDALVVAPMVRGLVRAPAPIAEPALLQLLPQALGDVRAEILLALGTLGTVAAIEVLAEVTKAGSSEHRRLARVAMSQIQQRAGGERGSLSLANSASGGELSFTDREQGALAISSAALLDPGNDGRR